MALFKNMVITYAGMALFAKAQAGQEIHFTKMQVGSGQVGTRNPSALTSLIEPKIDIPISSITPNTENKSATIIGNITNKGLTEAVYICEIGIWAKDPNDGEILYGYANCGTYGDYYAPELQGAYSWQYQISAAIGNAANVTANISELIWDHGVMTSSANFLYLKGVNQKEINKSIDDAITSIRQDMQDKDLKGFETDVLKKFEEVESSLADKTNKNDYVANTGYAVTSGTATAYTITLTPAPNAYADGQQFIINPHVDCGVAPTLNINGLGALPILKQDGSAVAAGDIKANKPLSLVRVGSNFFIRSGGGNSIKSIQRGTANLSSMQPLDISITNINVSNSIIIITSYNYAYTDSEHQFATAKITSSNNIQLQRIATDTYNTTVAWQVIEFNNVKSKQTGSLTTTSATSIDVIISSINVNKSILFFSARGSVGTQLAYLLNVGTITNSTTINFARLNNAGIIIEWQIIEFN